MNQLDTTLKISNQIALELSVARQQIDAAIELYDGGATIPFIARYRKEAVGGLDDSQLREFESRLAYLRDLEARKLTILESISEQNKLTPELEEKIAQVLVKSELEELYAPFKPKRQTKGQIAIKAGLEPLADLLWNNPEIDPINQAQAFIEQRDKQNTSPVETFKTPAEVLDGCKYILLERFSEDADLIQKARNYLLANATLSSRLISKEDEAAVKYKDYFEHDESIQNPASHRILAMLRGRNQGILALKLSLGEIDPSETHPIEKIITEHLGVIFNNQPADRWRKQIISWVWKIKLSLHLEADIINRLRSAADISAIDIFAKNLQALLLTAPAKSQITLGVDPGIRTGIKLAVVDGTGKLLTTGVVYPFTKKDQAADQLIELIKKFHITLIAIGNGTASRESQKFIQDLLDKHQLNVQIVIVNEAGASIYSASQLAANEFPDLDVSLRGAVSIARRLQDPLAELVKIEPKSLGVGQYQHDVNQDQLEQKLDTVVEDCVNKVGVDLNTASVPLLSRVSGIKSTIAKAIIQHRDAQGAFVDRTQLLEVHGLGAKTYEQAVGFLRINTGNNPLDKLGIHPESYPVVEAILRQQNLSLSELIGNKKIINNLKASDYVTEQFGLPTILDIFSELEKNGRDPREEFKIVQFDKQVTKIEDLLPGMELEGVVSNISNFGVFVDIGVHQDGLVHISELSYQFVKDPYTLVTNGQIVKVKVLDVDVDRKRISLSMKLDNQQGQEKNNSDNKKKFSNKNISATQNKLNNRNNYHTQDKKSWRNEPPKKNGIFAQALAKALKK